jgi:carbon storage regulator
MLVLSRKPGEKVRLGDGITVTVLEVNRGRVRIGIEAPGQFRILRADLGCWQEEGRDGEIHPNRSEKEA